MKSILTYAFLCITIISLQAQNRWGLQTGMNVASIHIEQSDFSDSYNDIWDSRTGFTAGVFMEHSFTEKTGLHTEVGYSLSGAVSAWTDRLDLHYLAVPVTFYYKPLARLKLYAGPQLNYLLYAKSDQMGSTLEKEVDDQFKNLDYGVLTGIEFKLVDRIGLSVRNYFGLLYNYTGDIRTYDIEGDPLVVDGPKRNRNNIFQVCIQYYFTGK